MADEASGDSDIDDIDEAEDGKKTATKSFALRFQKKLLGMSVKSKGVAKTFIDDSSGELLDQLELIAVKYSGDSKVAKKVMKDLIKVVVKLGLLYRHSQFSPDELTVAQALRSKFKMSVLTILSYHSVDFTFDQAFLANLLDECKTLILRLIERHLTDKSKGRVENVFGFFASGELLTKLYQDPEFKPLLDNFAKGLEQLSDEGKL
eukprot:m.277884 g.277884  ORF g.277884 m.277884 type:complete len:206 (+) comp54881_c1_seq4:211-828(+)